MEQGKTAYSLGPESLNPKQKQTPSRGTRELAVVGLHVAALHLHEGVRGDLVPEPARAAVDHHDHLPDLADAHLVRRFLVVHLRHGQR